jgi:hypothetical protein
MDWLLLIGIVLVVLAGISVLAYLRRIATATERIADALERQNAPVDHAKERA